MIHRSELRPHEVALFDFINGMNNTERNDHYRFLIDRNRVAEAESFDRMRYRIASTSESIASMFLGVTYRRSIP
jgi:hypothetical protein